MKPIILKDVLEITFPKSLTFIRVQNLTELRKMRDDLNIQNPLIYKGKHITGNFKLYLLTQDVIYFCIHTKNGLEEHLKTNDDYNSGTINKIPKEDKQK